MEYQKFITQTLQAAAAIANENFDKVTSISTKTGDNNQVLTETDLAIGKLIIQKIQELYPGYNIIDEEAGVIAKQSRYTWVVDPIDGTSNFANGLPTYGVMIGLLDREQPIAGGIALPAFNQIYVAEKGSGAFCNGQPIHVTDEKSLMSSLVAYGIDGHQEAPDKTLDEVAVLAKIILNIRNLRSTNSAYDMVHVADGKYGAFLNQTSKIWDNVAIQIIIEEAGGVVTDFLGQPMDFSKPLTKTWKNYTICAAAPELHKQLQMIIHGGI